MSNLRARNREHEFKDDYIKKKNLDEPGRLEAVHVCSLCGKSFLTESKHEHLCGKCKLEEEETLFLYDDDDLIVDFYDEDAWEDVDLNDDAWTDIDISDDQL